MAAKTHKKRLSIPETKAERRLPTEHNLRDQPSGKINYNARL